METPELAIVTVNKYSKKYYRRMSVDAAAERGISPESYKDNGLLRVVGTCGGSPFNMPGDTCPIHIPLDVRQDTRDCDGFERAAWDKEIGGQAICYLCKHWNGISLSEARMLTYYLNKPSDIISPIIMKKFIGYAAMERGNILPTTKAVIDRFNDLDFRDYDY